MKSLLALSLVPDRMRATASAVLLCLTIVGASVGPLVVGWLSDLLAPEFGVQSLRFALCSMAVTGVLSAVFFHLERFPHELSRGGFPLQI